MSPVFQNQLALIDIKHFCSKFSDGGRGPLLDSKGDLLMNLTPIFCQKIDSPSPMLINGGGRGVFTMGMRVAYFQKNLKWRGWYQNGEGGGEQL